VYRGPIFFVLHRAPDILGPALVAGVKRTIATGFEVLRFRPLLLLVIIGIPFLCLLFPPAVTAGVSWTQVMTRTLSTGVVADV
jgi:hypothetical protein